MASPRIAFKTSMELTGMEELGQLFTTDGPREARNIARQAVHGLAVRARDVLKRRVAKRSKALAKSIKAVRRRGKPDFPVSEVRGGATAPYMLMLEFGTSDTRAQPFIVPGVEELRPQMAQHYRDEFGKKYEKAMAAKARRVAKAQKL
jgi:HK97 gp10 family phage protein